MTADHRFRVDGCEDFVCSESEHRVPLPLSSAPVEMRSLTTAIYRRLPVLVDRSSGAMRSRLGR